MERDQAIYRQALVAVVAAVYRVLETWEEGDLAARVTALGAIARRWDTTLGLAVAGRRSTQDTDGLAEEDTTDA